MTERRRTSLLPWLAIGVPALLLAIGGCAPADDGEGPLELRYGFIGSPGAEFPASEIGYGLQDGSFEAALSEGLGREVRVTATVLSTGPELNDALLSGDLDAVTYGDTPALVAKSNGIDTRLLDFSGLGLASVIFTVADGPDSLEELDGKSVSVVLGSSMHRELQAIASDAGITIDWVTGGSDVSLLDSGSIAGIAGTGSTPQVFDAISDTERYKVVVDTSDHPGAGYSVQSLVAQEFLSRAPGFAGAWRTARAEAAERSVDEPSAFYAWVAEQEDVSAERAAQQWPLDRTSAGEDDLDAGLESLRRSQRLLIEAEVITREVDIDAWVASDDED
jgi:ABC-type nitrate/sulfonate/bicarbonate transport system substrate-binding protein